MDAEKEQMKARIMELEMAIQYAIQGMDLACTSAEKKFIDETLLHLGHHRARLYNVLNGKQTY